MYLNQLHLFYAIYFFVFNVLNFMFLTTSLSTTSLNLFKFIGTVFNLTISNSSTFLKKIFKLLGTFTSVLMSSLSSSAFKVIKSFLAAKSDVSTPVS